MADPKPCERALLGVYKDLVSVIARIQCSMLRRTARSILTPALTHPGRLQCRSLLLTTPRTNLVRPSAHLYDYGVRAGGAVSTAKFHSTPRREGLPFLMAGMASVLKASTALELTRTAGRIAMTFIPVLFVRNLKSRRRIKHAALHGVPASEEKVNKLLRRIRFGTLMLNSLFLVPFTLFWATVIASLEQTPLTGRWRMIILSPDEEDEISAQLAGQGWYRAVDDILAQDGPPKYISSSDWRYAWASETLRKLEATIPILLRESEMCADWTERGEEDPPLPPPAQYPLTPRPRASETLHRMCQEVCNKRKNPNWKPQPVANTFVGPPYALLLVDKPDAANAFSYGFGPDGGGGVVIYSGFLDEIFSKYPIQCEAPSVEKNKSWWSLLLGNLLPSSSTPIARPQPTPEQTTELAILLAHELSHLILSHHLESLSSSTIVVPGIFSIASDVVRMLIFPVTMLFGPFVNDAVAQLGKVGSGELTKLGLHCTSWKQEIEADVVSARLLAHAGFDAREAVKFWEERAPVGCSSPAKDRQGNSVQGIRGESHPLNEVRVAKFKKELQRWKNVREAVLAQRQRTSS